MLLYFVNIQLLIFFICQMMTIVPASLAGTEFSENKYNSSSFRHLLIIRKGKSLILYNLIMMSFPLKVILKPKDIFLRLVRNLTLKLFLKGAQCIRDSQWAVFHAFKFNSSLICLYTGA